MTTSILTLVGVVIGAVIARATVMQRWLRSCA